MQRATEGRKAAVHATLARDYPALATWAKVEGVEVQWTDETEVSDLASYLPQLHLRARRPYALVIPEQNFVGCTTLSVIQTIDEKACFRS